MHMCVCLNALIIGMSLLIAFFHLFFFPAILFSTYFSQYFAQNLFTHNINIAIELGFGYG